MGGRLNQRYFWITLPISAGPNDAVVDNTFRSRDLHSHSLAVVAADGLDRFEVVEDDAVHPAVHSIQDNGRAQHWLASDTSMVVASWRMEQGAKNVRNVDVDVARSKLPRWDRGLLLYLPMSVLGADTCLKTGEDGALLYSGR